MAAGVSILERERPDLMYLSTTDYVQHKAAPGSDVANAFYAMMDRYVGALDAAGCVLALTADHGMNDKHLPNGEPDVIYLQDLFDEWLGKGKARVILPITDPYVAHHGALGSFATVYLPAGIEPGSLIENLRGLNGVDVALARADACKRFELPPDRIGDIVVISTIHKVLGTSRGAPRSLGPHRAAALAWRAHRGDGADDRQPQGVAAGGSQAAQFRRVRCGAQPRRADGIADEGEKIEHQTGRRPPRGDAHRRQARRDRRADRGAQSLYRRGGRHRAGGAARACARGLRQGAPPSSRSSRATSASRSCCGPPTCCATARKSSRAHHRRVRAVLEGFALRGGPRLRRLFVRRPAHHQGRRRNLFLRYLAATASSARSSRRACRCSA